MEALFRNLCVCSHVDAVVNDILNPQTTYCQLRPHILKSTEIFQSLLIFVSLVPVIQCLLTSPLNANHCVSIHSNGAVCPNLSRIPRIDLLFRFNTVFQVFSCGARRSASPIWFCRGRGTKEVLECALVLTQFHSALVSVIQLGHALKK